jgi:energy-coupling factor transport system permease protein
MAMHPFVKILLFIFILVVMGALNPSYICLLCILVCSVAAKLNVRSLLRVVKRMRWLFLSMLIIYSFDTPGEYIQQFPTNYAPTIEGAEIGMLQIAKLLIALATLSILFSTTTNARLMSGLYLLLSPLSEIGLNVKKFTARLLLTLEYVEELAIKDSIKIKFEHLNSINLDTENLSVNKVLELEVLPFNLIDKIILTMLLVCTIVLIYLKGMS